MRTPVALIIIIVALMSASARAQTCDALLANGMYNFSDTTVTTNTAQAYLSWYCEQNFQKAQDANSFGANISFPFEGLPVQLGLNGSDSDFRQQQEALCTSNAASFTNNSAMRQYIKNVDEKVLDAFTECMKAFGLHVWMERSNRDTFFVFARFITPSDKIRTVNLHIDTTANLQCPGIRKGPVGPGDFEVAQCTRVGDDSASVAVTSGFAKDGNVLLTLPAAYKPLPLPPPPNMAFKHSLDPTSDYCM